jgi:Transposase IS66 family
MLAGYRGIVMSDGFAGYNFLDKRPGITFASCWSHVRRGFNEVEAKYPEAERVVDLIDELYDIERQQVAVAAGQGLHGGDGDTRRPRRAGFDGPGVGHGAWRGGQDNTADGLATGAAYLAGGLQYLY